MQSDNNLDYVCINEHHFSTDYLINVKFCPQCATPRVIRAEYYSQKFDDALEAALLR